MADKDESSFLSRWSKRKVQAREGLPVEPTAPAVEPVKPNQSQLDQASVREAQAKHLPAESSVDGAASHPSTLPSVTMDDVALLKSDSDYTAFVSRSVDPGVRNAALKKLFTDPHYNVMDGLDTYIDDYSIFEPIPQSMLRQMVQARSLGLLDDELEEQPKPDADAAPPAELATDNPPPIDAHEDTDLQLQPDDAAGPSELGEGVDGTDVAVDIAADEPGRDPHRS